jgi:hypothetical protein
VDSGVVEFTEAESKMVDTGLECGRVGRIGEMLAKQYKISVRQETFQDIYSYNLLTVVNSSILYTSNFYN